MLNLQFDSLQVKVYLPNDFLPEWQEIVYPVRHVIYILEPDEMTDELDLTPTYLRDAAIVEINHMNWADDLSPWPAPYVFKSEGDFTGGANLFLVRLLKEVIPCVEGKIHKEYQIDYDPEQADRALLGISLAGLFSVYAVYKTDAFRYGGSISGSLWFDKFIDFMKENEPVHKEVAAVTANADDRGISPGAARAWEKFYFSLGDREKFTKNPRMKTVEDCTKEAAEILQAHGIRTTFELNPGNHFVDGALRTERAIRWLLNN